MIVVKEKHLSLNRNCVVKGGLIYSRLLLVKSCICQMMTGNSEREKSKEISSVIPKKKIFRYPSQLKCLNVQLEKEKKKKN